MRLWAIWDTAQHDHYTRHRCYRASWARVDPSHMDQYRWMCGFVPRVGEPKSPAGADIPPPVWAWYAYDGVAAAPNLNDAWHLPEGETGYCVELLVEPARVLLSQFNMWCEVLNNAYIPEDERESEEFESSEHRMTDDEIRRAKRRTWPRIFDLAFGSEDFWGPRSERSIQACLDGIREADVVGLTRFVAT